MKALIQRILEAIRRLLQKLFDRRGHGDHDDPPADPPAEDGDPNEPEVPVDDGRDWAGLGRTILVDIHASAAAQPIGLHVSDGQQVGITAVSGEWEAGPDGVVVDWLGDQSRPAGPGAPLPDEPLGALIGTVAQTTFLVGAGTGVPSGLAGDLRLGINDAESGGVGALTVRIDTSWPTAVVTIKAGKTWQTTGLTIPPEQRVTVTARSGRWLPNPDLGYCDAAGYEATAGSTFPLPDAPQGALVAKVGDAVVLIGNGTRLPSGASGELFLMANDDHPDNGHKLGQIGVEITTVATEVVVPARTDWAPTGVIVHRGATISVRGTAAAFDSFPPEGQPGTTAGADAPIPDAPLHSLVGSVGGTPFPIGRGAFVPGDLAGELLLAANVPSAMRAGDTSQIHAEIDGAVPVAGARSCLAFGADVFVRARPPMNRETYATVTAWVRVDAPGDGPIPIVSGADETGTRFTLMLNPLSASFTLNDQPDDVGVVAADPSAEPALGSWEHVAFVVGEANVELFTGSGGVVASSPSAGAIRTALGFLAIGADHEPAGNTSAAAVDATPTSWRGSIAEVAIWNRALSADEVAHVGRAELRGDEHGLVAYWPLHEGRGAHVADMTRLKSGVVAGAGAPPDGGVGETLHGAQTWSTSVLPVARTVPVRVQTSGIWQATGVEIVQIEGAPIIVTVRRARAADGTVTSPDPAGTIDLAPASYPLPGHPVDMLLGKVDHVIFPIGSSATIPQDVVGELTLMVNADLERIRTNRGSLDVAISVPPAAEARVPERSQRTAHRASKSSALSAAKQAVAASIKEAHAQADAKVAAAHDAAKRSLEAAASLEVVYASGPDGLAQWRIGHDGAYRATTITDDFLQFRFADSDATRFAPKIALDRGAKRIYWASAHEWAPAHEIDIHSASWDGTDKRTATVALGDGSGPGRVLDAMAIDPNTSLYLVHHVPAHHHFPVVAGRKLTMSVPDLGDRIAIGAAWLGKTQPNEFHTDAQGLVTLASGTKLIDDTDSPLPGPTALRCTHTVALHVIDPSTKALAVAPVSTVTFERPLGMGFFGFRGFEGYVDAWNERAPSFGSATMSTRFDFPMTTTIVHHRRPDSRPQIDRATLAFAPLWFPTMPGVDHTNYAHNAEAATTFSAAYDVGNQRLYMAGAGGAWTMKRGAVEPLDLATPWPISIVHLAETDRIYWGDRAAGDAAMLSSAAALTSADVAATIDRATIVRGPVIGPNAVALDAGATRAFVAADDHIDVVDLSVGSNGHVLARIPSAHNGQVIVEDPLKDMDDVLSESLAAEKTAAADKALRIAEANASANAKKAAAQTRLGAAHSKAQTDRDAAKQREQAKVRAKQDELDAKHTDRDAAVTAATSTAKSKRDAANAAKNSDVARARAKAAADTSSAQARLDAERRRRR